MASQADTDTSGTLKELKEVIFDLDWEISDSFLDKLISVITPLKRKWGDRKPYLVCLKIIDNVGHYIKKAKHKAHPEAVKLLSSVFQTLETIESDNSLSENDIVKLVRVELEKYNGLKGEITGDKKAEGEKSEREEQAGAASLPPSALSPVAEESRPEEGGEREVVLTRAEDQSFPEAEQLLDDFFADDEWSSHVREDAQKPQGATEATEVEEDETVEFDLGGTDRNKTIANIFGATEAELEAQVGEKLGVPEEEVLEERKIPAPETDSCLQEDYGVKVEEVINQFSREITAVIAQEVRKAVREEMAKVQQGE